jgi:UDP-glucose 4-epimerase
MFKPPVMIGVAGFDPRMQFVHEYDLIQVIETFLNQKKGGIFNVASDGDLRYSEVAKLARKKLLRLPHSLIKALMHISWVLHLQNDSPYSGIEFIKYPPVVSTGKLLKEIGFRVQVSVLHWGDIIILCIHSKESMRLTEQDADLCNTQMCNEVTAQQ